MIARKGSYGKGGQRNDLRQKVMLLLIPILAGVLWLLLRDSLPPKPATAAETTEEQVTPTPVVEDIEIDWQTPPLCRLGDRDPMQLAPPARVTTDLAVSQAPTSTGLILRGILYTREHPVVMINSSLVYEGQDIGPVTVIRIAQDRVTFEMEGRQWVQMISTPAIQPPSDEQ